MNITLVVVEAVSNKLVYHFQSLYTIFPHIHPPLPRWCTSPAPPRPSSSITFVAPFKSLPPSPQDNACEPHPATFLHDTPKQFPFSPLSSTNPARSTKKMLPNSTQ